MKRRIAIQNKGRLKDPSVELLRKMGIEFELGENDLIVKCKNADIELLFVRNADIPIYVQKGAADFGIVGKNVLYEKDLEFKFVKDLDFGKCSLVIAGISEQNLEGERIATSYPNSLKKYLSKNGINASIIEIQGSVEIAPALNLADAICDITQSGETLKKMGLQVLDKVFDSQACLISNNYEEILL